MENKGGGRIPRYIDAPVTILMWPIDIFLPAFVLIIAGVFTHNFILFTSIACGYGYVISVYQKNFPRGVMGNLMHTIGLFPYKGYPDGYTKTFHG